VLSFNSTGNITAPQLLSLTGALNRNFVPVSAAFNPWTSAAWGGAGYGAGAAGYGAGSGGYGGGGNYISSSAPPNESPPIYYTRQPTQTGQSIVFDALGLPTQGGQLAWPIGLRVLPPDQQTRALRREIETDLLRIVQQAAANLDTAGSVKQTRDDIRQLRQALNENSSKLSEGMVAEAKRFLNQLDRAAEGAAAAKPAANAEAKAPGY
jgi:hypothetical protein